MPNFTENKTDRAYVGCWNYKNPAVAEARQAGPPPKPQNNMEMGGM